VLRKDGTSCGERLVQPNAVSLKVAEVLQWSRKNMDERGPLSSLLPAEPHGLRDRNVLTRVAFIFTLAL